MTADRPLATARGPTTVPGSEPSTSRTFERTHLGLTLETVPFPGAIAITPPT